jgi:hypothetical protein
LDLMRKIVLQSTFWVGLLLALAGCGLGSSLGGEGAASGVGRLDEISVSATQVQEVYPNLIANGDFGLWWAGAPAPERFQRPDPEMSAVSRVRGAGAAPFAAQQVWRAPDAKAGPVRMFGVETEVEAGVRYTLSVTAERVATGAVSVWLWRFDAAGKPEALESPFLQLGPSLGICKRYVRSFTPDRGGALFITSKAEVASTVIWHEWLLTRDPDQE